MTVHFKKYFLMSLRYFMGLCLGLGLGLTAQAYELQLLTVEKDDYEYRLEFFADVDISSNHIHAYFQDLDQVAKITPSVISSKVSKGESNTDIRVRLRPCVLFMCKTMLKKARYYPEQCGFSLIGYANFGSFKFINDIFHFQSLGAGDRTRINFKSSFDVRFFVPDWIGTIMIKRSADQYIEEFLKRLESIDFSKQNNPPVNC